MGKPYDEKRLARAVHDILRSVLATKCKSYYSKLTYTTLADSKHALVIIKHQGTIMHQYTFIYKFVRGSNPPELAIVGADAVHESNKPESAIVSIEVGEHSELCVRVS